MLAGGYHMSECMRITELISKLELIGRQYGNVKVFTQANSEVMYALGDAIVFPAPGLILQMILSCLRQPCRCPLLKPYIEISGLVQPRDFLIYLLKNSVLFPYKVI